MLLAGIDHVATLTSGTDRLHRFDVEVFEATVSVDQPGAPGMRIHFNPPGTPAARYQLNPQGVATVHTHSDRRLRALVAAAALVVGLAACGSDDDDDASVAPAESSSDHSDASAELAVYCTDVITLDQMFQHFDAEDPPAFEAALAEAVPVTERIVAGAPAELEDEYAVLSAAFGEVVDTADPAPFFTPEVDAADDAVHAHHLDYCGWTVAEITAENFHFTGTFPTEAGQVSFDLANTGDEAHALMVARKLDEVEGSAVDAFNALESEEALPTAFEQAVAVFAEPGDSAYGLVDLAPGEYVAYCPIPSGTVGEDSIGDGPPHFTQGMVTTFEVSER